jgi:hypothetical protein
MKMKKLQIRQRVKQQKQVSRKAAKINDAIAAERKDIWVLSAQIRTQSKRKIGTSRNKATQYYMEAEKAEAHQDDCSDGDNESIIRVRYTSI